MPHTAEDAACRGDLRRAGLPGHWGLARLLGILRAAPETHLGLAQVVRLAAKSGLAGTAVEVARKLETLADHGLLRRLPTTSIELVFDTVPEPHCHIVYEETAQTVDLHVSAETLLALLRRALTETPGEVDILIRFKAPARTAQAEPTPDAGAVRRSAKSASTTVRGVSAAVDAVAADDVRF
jgi:Fe2+ or Zn2+ uptake regulation protein